MKFLKIINLSILCILIFSCNSNNEYKEYKTNGVIDSIVYKVFVRQVELDRGVGADDKLIITKNKSTGADILTFRGTFDGIPANYSYYCYGTEEEKGETSFKNGSINTRHTVILTRKDYDHSNHFLHKYYIDNELVLIKDEDTGRGIFVPQILDKRIIDYDKK